MAFDCFFSNCRAQIPRREDELFIAIYVSVMAFGTNPRYATNQQLVPGCSAWWGRAPTSGLTFEKMRTI